MIDDLVAKGADIGRAAPERISLLELMRLQVERLAESGSLLIPKDLIYLGLPGISREVAEKLKLV